MTYFCRIRNRQKGLDTSGSSALPIDMIVFKVKFYYRQSLPVSPLGFCQEYSSALKVLI